MAVIRPITPTKKITEVQVLRNRQRTWLTNDEKFEILAACVKIGFHIAPITYIAPGGVCSCGRHLWSKEKKPCGKAGKHPIYKGWEKDCITTTEELKKQLPKNKPNNWCCSLGKRSGVWVLDVDPRNDGDKKLAAYEAQHGPLPKTLTATTGGGGKHIIFRYPTDGRSIKNDSGGKKLGLGLDVKSDGGLIVISPSRHQSGNLYKFDAMPGTVEIVDAPAWLLDLVCDKEETAKIWTPEEIEAFKKQHQESYDLGGHGQKYVYAALNKEVDRVLACREGSRNDTLNKAAHALARYFHTGLIYESDVYSALLDAAQAIGLDISEADATIKSGFSAGIKKPKSPPDPDEYYRKKQAERKAARELQKTAEPVVFEMSQSEIAEFDRHFGAAMDRELELQKLPNYKELCEEEARRQREEQERIDEGNRQRTPEPEPHPPVPLDPIKWHRCHECDPETAHRHCPKCATEKLGVTRPRPVDSPCTRGGRYLVQSTEKGKEGRLAKFQPKCGMWGCYKCGYDNECDHLAHYMLIAQDMNDSYETPIIHLPDYHIENPKTARVGIQNGVWKATVHEDHRRKYANKLSKMGVYYIIDYVGDDKYSVYCFLPAGIDENRLDYSTGRAEISAEKITFRQFDQEHRMHLSNFGRFIKLQKSLWDLCDKPFGARKRHNAVTYCKALRMPRRMVSTGKNRLVGAIMLNEEEILKVCEEMGADTYRGDTRKIDLSHKRGLTQYLIEFIRYDLKDACDETIQRFIDRLTGKDKIVEPAYDAYEYTAGSSCLQYPLVT